MSLAIPLTVSLSTTRSPSRFVTHEVRDLTFRWTDPGGFASCQIALDRPLNVEPDEFAYYSPLTVYDARSGDVVFDGRMEDPGRSAGDGQVYDLVAVGGQAHTLDRTVALLYADRKLQTWPVITSGSSAVQISISGDLVATLQMQVPRDTVCGVGFAAGVANREGSTVSLPLARVAFDWDAGVTDANWRVQIFLGQDGGATAQVTDAGLSTAGGSLAAKVGDTNFDPTDNVALIRLARITSSQTVANDDTNLQVTNLAVRWLLKNATGSDITSGYTIDTVLASQVVADLLGRLLTQYDGANATVTTTSYNIDQLAYPDGATANKVLADLMELERGYTWRVWERNSAGKFRFEWTPVPSTVRYEADVSDGYDSTGSADGLYNKVTVRWRDSAGMVRSAVRTASVPILTAAGIDRQDLRDLGDEIGSAAAATQAGDQWLADHANPPNAGRLRIARKILDLQTGRMVEPWEIRPGLIRVRGIQPRPDALNATSRDGVTIFRIVASEFRASDGAATLELDSYAPSTARMLADLSRRPNTRRR